MSKRINVMISDVMNEKLDNYSERYGVTKSSIVGFVLGQWVDNIERMNSSVYGPEGLLSGLFSEIAGEPVEEKKGAKV
jgi:predicted DNA-binding protein